MLVCYYPLDFNNCKYYEETGRQFRAKLQYFRITLFMTISLLHRMGVKGQTSKPGQHQRVNLTQLADSVPHFLPLVQPF